MTKGPASVLNDGKLALAAYALGFVSGDLADLELQFSCPDAGPGVPAGHLEKLFLDRELLVLFE